MEWLLAGVLLVAAMAVGLVFGTAWSRVTLRPQAVVTPPAALSPPPAARDDDVDYDRIEERVAKLERTFPEWLVAMESMAAQAREVLDQADRKRRSVVQAEKRAAAREDASGAPNSEQPEVWPAADLQTERKNALRAVRARRGW